MLKELLLKETKANLNLLINTTKDKYLSSLDEEDQEEVSTIINKNNYTLEDINNLLIDYFPYELSDEELSGLIKNSSFRKKIAKKETLIHIIESYLINNPKYQPKILSLINKKININDIELLDKYLEDPNFADNKEIIPILQRLSNITNENIKKILTNLSTIFTIFENNLLDLELIKSFYDDEITKYNNYYFQYQEIITKVLKNTNSKDNALLCLIFIENIDAIKDIQLTKEDLLNFIEKLEKKGFILNNNQINNLLNNFRQKYYEDNDKNNIIPKLKKKVFETYDEYFKNNFYFKIGDFITYYNELYQDDFSLLCFSQTNKPLDRNIFDSLFSIKGVNETTIILEKELINYKSFKLSIIDYKVNCLEEDKIYYERYKFYLKYINHIQSYLDYKNDITIDYYVLKNIPVTDRGNFYELFQSYYGNNYREIGRTGHSIQKSYLLLKKEFIEELNSSPFEKRYEILNKYKEYCITLKSLSLFNESHLLEIMKEYENKYYNVSVSKKKRHKK